MLHTLSLASPELEESTIYGDPENSPYFINDINYPFFCNFDMTWNIVSDAQEN